MMKPGRIVTELYSLISSADFSLLRIQKAILSFKCQVGIFSLDQLEKKFRELFNLASYINQNQNESINFIDSLGNKNQVYISGEFLQKLKNEFDYGETMISKGYTVFIKKTKLYNNETDRTVLDQNLRLELESMKLFLNHLERSLRLTRHVNIHFDQIFAFVPHENRIVKPRPILPLESFSNKHFSFEEKDNYVLKIFLSIENRISNTLDLAMKNFIESFHIQNPKLRYINMLLCLDLCFNITSGESFDIICGYVSSLLARNDGEFKILLNETRGFYQLKNKIITGNALDESIAEPGTDIVNRKIARLEEIIRMVLKKMVRFNHKERDKFKEELRSKM